MATLNELVGLADAGVNPVGSAMQGVQQGMSLAKTKQDMEMQKINMEDMKEKLETNKVNSALSGLSVLARARPEIGKKLVPHIVEKFRKANIPVDPIILETMATDDEHKRRYNLVSESLKGKVTDPATRAETLMAFNEFGMFETGLKAYEDQYKNEQALSIAEMKAKEAGNRADGTQSRSDRGTALNMYKEAIGGIKTISKEYNKNVGSYANINAALERGDVASVRQVLANIAKGVGEQVGTLTDNDIANIVPPTFATNLDQFVMKLTNEDTKYNETVVKSLKKLVQTAQANNQQKYKNMLTVQRNKLSKGDFAAPFFKERWGEVIDSELSDVDAMLGGDLGAGKISSIADAKKAGAGQAPGAPPAADALKAKQDEFRAKASKLINPATKKPYTAEEIEKLVPQQ